MKTKIIRLIKRLGFANYEEAYLNRIVEKDIIRRKLIKNNSLNNFF